MKSLESLNNLLLDIIILLNENIDHIPPVNESSHEFDISFMVSNNNGISGSSVGSRTSSSASRDLSNDSPYRARVMSAPPVPM